jgi:hypothetical protein
MFSFSFRFILVGSACLIGIGMKRLRAKNGLSETEVAA